MPKHSMKTAICCTLLSMFFFTPYASAASVVDQSQLSYNVVIGLNTATGQSFQAGKSGQLTDIDVYSNGPVLGGSNTITLQLYSGNGTSGTSLGSLTEVVSNPGNFLLDINTQSLNLNLKAGNEYTFLLNVTAGAGDLLQRGLLADAADPYANGQLFSGAAISSWDLSFQTLVNPVPTPATLYLLVAGFFSMAHWLGRKNAA